MDNDQFAWNEQKKSKILKSVAQLLIDAYGGGKISYFEMKKAASYILDHFDEVQSNEGLFFFLENLSAYWQIFRNVLILEEQGKKSIKEKEVIQKLSQYIKSSVSK